MSIEFKPELAAALLAAQGVSTTPESAADGAKFAAAVLERARAAFAHLAIEDEPGAFSAAQRRAAP